MHTSFIRLIASEDKQADLKQAVCDIRDGASNHSIYHVDPGTFRKVPGAPFAYWVADRVLNCFTELEPFQGNSRTMKQGIATADDFRFVRTWWEVAADRIVTAPRGTKPAEYVALTYQGRRWVPFAKGGAYSPYYADIHLVVNWERDGEEIRNFVDPDTGRPLSRPQNTHLCFLPGLTWSDRTTKLFSARTWPEGGVFSVKGSAGFFGGQESLALGLMNSLPFNGFLSLMVGASDAAARSYQVGTLGRVPFPAATDTETLTSVARLAQECFFLKRSADSATETSHTFVLPALLQSGANSLSDRVADWAARQERTAAQLTTLQEQIDSAVAKLYGFTAQDMDLFRQTLLRQQTDPPIDAAVADDDEPVVDQEQSASTLTFCLLSWYVGVCFGRFNHRFATSSDPFPAPDEDPFSPVPDRSIGMRKPGREVEPVLVDDEGHPKDIVHAVRTLHESLFETVTGASEAELGLMLGFTDLREFFRSKTGFFAQHARQYSMSRRKAPIYWYLASAQRNYGLWLYYPSLTKDTLYTALREHVDPKLAHEVEGLNTLQVRLNEARATGNKAERSYAKQVAAQEDLVAEIAAFRDELKALADAGYDPDLDDGVLINIAPLHKLVPWKEAAACYKDLKAGKYPWANMYKRYNFR